MSSDDIKFNISNIKFNICAFLFQGLWLLYHKLYLCFFMVLGLSIIPGIIILAIAIPNHMGPVVLLIWPLVLGLWGEEIKRCIQASRRRSYEAKGYSGEKIEELLKPSFKAPIILGSVCGGFVLFLIIIQLVVASLVGGMLKGMLKGVGIDTSEVEITYDEETTE